jgi:excisionase family DNA binding protein
MTESLRTVQEAADFLHISARSIYNLVKARKLSAYMLGHKWLFSAADLDAYVESTRIPATAGDVE